MENNVILELKNASKHFPGVKALDGVNFNLRKGEVHALVGENGAGKSTLIKLISGLYSFTTGEMFFDGQKVSYKTPHEAIEAGISVIYQELNLIPDMSIAENIYFAHLPANKIGYINQKKVLSDTKKLLEELGLHENPRTKLNTLPVAKQQLIEIAKAISTDAKVLIMDEPTSALSPTEIRNLFSIIEKLKQKGCAIIYVSHKLEEIFELSDRITVFRDGRYIDTVDTASVDENKLISLMVGRELSDLYPKQVVAPGEKVLEVEHLTSLHVKDISFYACAGEIVGFSGLMGAGRTELARAIIGYDKRISGTVKVNGVKVPPNATSAAKKAGIGYVPEDRKRHGIFASSDIKFNMTISSLKRLSNGIGNVAGRKEKKSVEEMVDKLAIKTPSIKQLISKLSGGNQQKVILARSLIMEGLRVLIIDEPTRGIDIGAKAEIYAILDDLAKSGIAVVMLSSEMPEVLSMSDRIYIMKHGRINGEISRAEASQEELLHRAI